MPNYSQRYLHLNIPLTPMSQSNISHININYNDYFNPTNPYILIGYNRIKYKVRPKIPP